MTVPNPFIELAQDPIGTLAVVGYALVLFGLILAATWWSLRKVGILANRYQKNRHSDAWWSGPFDIGIVPPPDWTATAVMILFVWAITLWALSALVWVIT